MRRSFPPLRLGKDILDSPYLLIPLINTKNKLTNAHYYSPKIYGPRSFIIYFVLDHSAKNWGPYRHIFFLIWTRPFDQTIWSFFIYSFFWSWLFDQKLGSSLIYFFYLRKTIRSKYMVLFCFHLFFLLHITFDQN